MCAYRGGTGPPGNENDVVGNFYAYKLFIVVRVRTFLVKVSLTSHLHGRKNFKYRT